MLEANLAMARARLRSAKEQSWLTQMVLVGFVVSYMIIGYLIFHGALSYLNQFALIGALLARRVLFLVLFFFMLMLIFSNLVIGYAAMFRSKETTWLLTLPVEPRLIFEWKLTEQIAMSSWAVLFCTLPLFAAYAVVLGGGILFFVLAWVLFIPFVVIPGVMAVFIALLIARYFSPKGLKILLCAGAAIALVLLYALVRPGDAERGIIATDFISLGSLIKQSDLLAADYLPSAWVARALLGVVDWFPAETFFYSWLIFSWAAAAWLIAASLGGGIFQRVWLRATDWEAGSLPFQIPRKGGARSQVTLLGLFADLRERIVRAIPIPNDAKALVLKDQKLFWREPAQWSQFLIFFGLLAIYIFNLRNLSVDITQPFWGVLISFLNLSSASFTATNLTTRFVFPQFSQEGRRLWIIGMSGIGLSRMVWIKFWASAVSTSFVTVPLIIGSSMMLKLPTATVFGFALAMTLISLALSGLAVGLGTLFPNLSEESPAKIVSGFGGTLCLVLSVVFLLLFIGALVLPVLFRLPDKGASVFEANWPTAISVLCCLLLSGAFAFVPMRLGALRASEMDL